MTKTAHESAISAKFAHLSPAERAAQLSRFTLWGVRLSEAQGIRLLNDEAVGLIELAIDELLRLWAADAERRRTASRNGKLGGRGRTKTPAPGTIRSRITRNSSTATYVARTFEPNENSREIYRGRSVREAKAAIRKELQDRSAEARGRIEQEGDYSFSISAWQRRTKGGKYIVTFDA